MLFIKYSLKRLFILTKVFNKKDGPNYFSYVKYISHNLNSFESYSIKLVKEFLKVSFIKEQLSSFRRLSTLWIPKVRFKFVIAFA